MPCILCVHPDRAVLDAALTGDEPQHELAAAFGASRALVTSHRRRCLGLDPVDLRARRCHSCSHPDADDIDVALLAGLPDAVVAERFGLGLGALSHHRRHHLGLPGAVRLCALCHHSRRDELHRLVLDDGVPVAAAARTVGVHEDVARSHLRHLDRLASWEVARAAAVARRLR